MDEITTQKVQQVNEILKKANIPMSFSFACYDLKTYKPQLTFTKTTKASQWIGRLGTHVTKEHVVQFYFKTYPQLPIAESYEDYAENLKQMKEWDKTIDALNTLKLQVPKYK